MCLVVARINLWMITHDLCDPHLDDTSFMMMLWYFEEENRQWKRIIVRILKLSLVRGQKYERDNETLHKLQIPEWVDIKSLNSTKAQVAKKCWICHTKSKFMKQISRLFIKYYLRVVYRVFLSSHQKR